MKSFIVSAAIILGLIVGIAEASRPKPFNRVAIIVDASGTFKDHQFAAIKKARILLEEIADKKEKRFEEPDEVYLISLDAKPEVIWYGKRQQLAQLTEEKISYIFRERRVFGNCTDIAKAFNLASHKLNRDPEATSKYLFVFSDLIDEPQTSGTKCKSPGRPSLPPENMDWDALTGTAIGVFWTPDDQIQAWEKALADKGVSIRFYNAAEAENAELPAPRKAHKKMTEDERDEKLAAIKGKGAWAAGVVMGVLKYGVIAILILAALAYYRNRNERKAVVTKTNNLNKGGR